MLFVSIKQDDFRKVAIEVRKILVWMAQNLDMDTVQHRPAHFDNLAVHGTRCFTEKLVGDKEIIRIQFLNYGDSSLRQVAQLAVALLVMG